MDNRTIDELITEKILKWEAKYSALKGEDGTVIYRSEFKPSTNIKDAWKVVNELRKKYIVRIEIDDTQVECCLLNEFPDNPDRVFATMAVEAHTAPLAICLVALKSIGFVIDHEWI